MSSGAATSLCVRRQESVRSLLFAHGKRESVCYIETWIARRHFGPSARSGTICTVATSQMHAPSKKAKAIAPPEDEPDAKQPFQGSAEDAAAAIVGAACKITTSAKRALVWKFPTSPQIFYPQNKMPAVHYSCTAVPAPAPVPPALALGQIHA